MENLNPEVSLPGGDDITPADGTGSESEVVELKDIMKSALGKEFPDNETALKSMKDTFSFVGKAGWYKKAVEAVAQAKGLDEKGAVKYIMENLSQEQPSVVPTSNEAPTIDPNKFVSREEYDREMYFGKNPDLEPYKGLIGDLQKATGKTIPEIIEMDSFKNVYSKAKAHDESEKNKSVLMSNPRLGQVQDKLTQAREAVKSGDMNTARANAVGAVLDAYESK